MSARYEVMTTISVEDFLRVIENQINQQQYMKKLYLIERNKPTVHETASGLVVKIESFAATPVRALRWDYGIGTDLINKREFIIANKKNAEKFVSLLRLSSIEFYGNLYDFKSDSVIPQLMTEDSITKGKLNEKLRVVSVHGASMISDYTKPGPVADEFYCNVVAALTLSGTGRKTQ